MEPWTAKAMAAIAHGNLGPEPQMAGHQVGCSFRVLMLMEALGEHVFLLCRQHRELLDLGQIAVEALLSAQRGDIRFLRFIHVFPNLSCVDPASADP